VTTQITDSLTLRDERRPLLVLPMESYFATLPEDKLPRYGFMFSRFNSANYRGYVASWEIAGGVLWLTGLWGDLEGRGPVGLAYFFGPGTTRVPATWVTGDLVVPADEAESYASFPIRRYSHHLLIAIDKGRVSGERTAHNPNYRAPPPPAEPGPPHPSHFAFQCRYLANRCDRGLAGSEMDEDITKLLCAMGEFAPAAAVAPYTTDREAAARLLVDTKDETLPAEVGALAICETGLRQRARLADKGI